MPRTVSTIPTPPRHGTRRRTGSATIPNYHGHNYELELSVEGEINPETGYVMDLNHLKELAQERLLRHLDHKNLNLDVPWFRELVPTSENIAVVCWRELRAADSRRAHACISVCGKRRGTMSTTKASKAGRPRCGAAHRGDSPEPEPHLGRSPTRSATSSRPWARIPAAKGWSRRPSGSSRRSGSSPRATT